MSMLINRYKGFPYPTVDCSKDKGLTVQANRDEVDINKIVSKIQKGISIPVFNGEPFYGDVSELGGLQEAMIKVQEAEDLFMQYPADTREKFDNDPVKFVEFMQDPKNTAEAVKLGLAQEKPAEPAMKAPEAPPAQKPT